MKKSKLIFETKFLDNNVLEMDHYKFNSMNRFGYFTEIVIEIRRDEKY